MKNIAANDCKVSYLFWQIKGVYFLHSFPVQVLNFNVLFASLGSKNFVGSVNNKQWFQKNASQLTLNLYTHPAPFKDFLQKDVHHKLTNTSYLPTPMGRPKSGGEPWPGRLDRSINGYRKIVGENLTNCRGVTCDGLASRPGGVEILLTPSCYRNRDKLRQLWAILGSKASLLPLIWLWFRLGGPSAADFQKASIKKRKTGKERMKILQGRILSSS